MAGKITDLTALASGHATGDLLEILDVSDTTMSVNGTNKKTTLAQLCGNFPSSVRGTGTTAASPALAVSLTANTGFYDYAGTGNFVAMTVAGVFGHLWDGTRYLQASTITASWSSTTDPAGTPDLGYARKAAGVLEINNGTDGNTRYLLGGGTAVASAAALPLPTGSVFHVTGTTGITSITSTNFQSGVMITLIFDGALTVTDGGNLKLAGNFTTTADDTLTLVYDGTNWYECARSVN